MGYVYRQNRQKHVFACMNRETGTPKMRIALAKPGKTLFCQCLSLHFWGVKSRSALANPQKSGFCQYLKCYYCLKMAAGVVYLVKHVCRKALAHWQNRQKREIASVKPKNDIPKWG